MNVEISVTWEDIAKGNRGDCFSCPIVLAMMRVFPEVYSASPLSLKAIASDGSSLRADPPDEAAQFMMDFDEGEAVRPLTFTADFR